MLDFLIKDNSMTKLKVDNDLSTSDVSDEFLITKRFKSSETFSQFIEKQALNSGSYIDSIVDYCVKNEIEMESVKRLITSSLKDKIKAEAQSLNLVKGLKEGKLPI